MMLERDSFSSLNEVDENNDGRWGWKIGLSEISWMEEKEMFHFTTNPQMYLD